MSLFSPFGDKLFVGEISSSYSRIKVKSFCLGSLPINGLRRRSIGLRRLPFIVLVEFWKAGYLTLKLTFPCDLQLLAVKHPIEVLFAIYVGF